MLYLVNPKSKGKRRMAKKKKRSTAAQRRAAAKARAAKKKKATARKRAAKKAAATRKRRSTASRRRKNPARRKPSRRRSTVARRRTRRRRRNPAKKRRKATNKTYRTRKYTKATQTYSRNPPFTLKNMGKILQRGVIDATGVTAGKVGARFVAGFIPSFGEGIMMNLAKQAVAALGVGFLAGQIVPRDYGRFIMAGALSAPVETGLAMVPVVGDLISGNAELGEAMGYGLPMGQPSYGLPMGHAGEYVQPDAYAGEYVEMYP